MENDMHPIKKWHELVETGNKDIYDEILADDVVFYSPVVHTPQKGKEITKIYLSAAGNVFGDSKKESSPKESFSNFKYTKEIIGENNACLEFENIIDGIHINGVDLITWNEDNLITEFRVLVRPLQAVNMLHKMMGEMLEKMNK
jgi:hypothetical protein|tara:strand:- start:1313 stop:1744 length:432 start_codon:yes stop_codon:yes gene_type:complete